MNEYILEQTNIPTEVINHIASYFANVNMDTYGNDITAECVTRMISVRLDDTEKRYKVRGVLGTGSIDVYGILRC